MIVFDIETGPLTEELVFAFTFPQHPGPLVPSRAKESELDQQAAAEAEWRANALARAALSAMTGQVVAIGFQNGSGAARILVDEEPKLLSGFWRLYQQAREKRTNLVGHNIFGFDLPFLIRRSWLLEIDVPSQVFDGRYFDRLFIDTMRYWQLGNWGSEFAKLDSLDRYFGGGGKNGDGAKFAELLKTDREAAVEYLKNDLLMTARVAARMGVI